MAETELVPPAFQFINATSLKLTPNIFCFSQKEGILKGWYSSSNALVLSNLITGPERLAPRALFFILSWRVLITMVSTLIVSMRIVSKGTTFKVSVWGMAGVTCAFTGIKHRKKRMTGIILLCI